MTALPGVDPAAMILTDVERSVLAADVARASAMIAPLWPLTSFVAVNPLGGLHELPFVEATAAARRWFSARTHLDLDSFRTEYARGVIGDAELRQAIDRALPWLAEIEPLELGRVRVAAADLVHWDLLHGPTPEDAAVLPPTLADALDAMLTTWCAAYVDDDHVPWAMPDRDLGFYRAWRTAAPSDRRLGALVGPEGRRRLRELPEDPVAMLHQAFERHGIAEADRVDAVRVLLLRTPGWAAFARWCDDWAPADRPGVRLRMLDLAAVRAAMDAVAPEHLDLGAPPLVDDEAEHGRRAEAAATAFGSNASSNGSADSNSCEREAVWSVIGRVTDDDRRAIWLAAHEWTFRNRLLGRLAPAPMPDAPTRPTAQLVLCIDVRSEGLRRHLEALGDYETFGFAGFFGVPVRWRPLGSEMAQARCPVLVSPRHEVAEVAIDDDHDYLASGAASAGLHDAFSAAKGGIASPFALAESAGWFAGPVATMRTMRPGRAVTSPASSSGTASWWRRRGAPRTAPAVDAVVAGQVATGFSLDERALFAEAIVTTIGISEFAPVIVLCGHGSETANNPHASSLDCGACGGAPGGASARIAAAILNDPDVRHALTERGIDIPTDTWFVAAEHDTTADIVTFFDRDSMPVAARAHVDDLERDLAVAGERNSQDRARRLSGRPERVRDRGRDWAQVRPEWGLAGNGAFIIGPRSMTADHDLAGRCFLHSYVAERDPDGVALETIMTAPLVVAQWISAQYYFSTVDPDVFGAGDKMLHNPVGGIGVVIGQGGDLAVGLPLQSVQLGEQRAHDPLRLLAVVQAPLDRIELIIERNSGLRHLVDGEWIHVVAREAPTDGWSFRTPAGGWEPWDIGDADAAATAPLLTPLEIS